jgi:glyoxylase-like metal-dependent hydrolase (beta-lactamase superfamily II)
MACSMAVHGRGLPFERIVVPTPYAVGPANVYVVAAQPVTLVDCGPNTPAAENALVLGLARLGLVPQQIARVVVTHGHPDHFGLAPRLQELSGAQVYAGELDLPKLAMDRSMLFATGRLLLQEGMPMDALIDMGERERKLGDIRPHVEGAMPLRDGDRVEFAGFDLEVLHLPGHTAGHICLLHRESGVLFSGDTLILHITPNPLIEPDPLDPSERRHSLIEYMATLDRLAAMDLETVYPGHGEAIEDPRGLIDAMRRHHRERTDDLAGRLADRPKTGWQLANEVFRNLEGFDNFLAVSEVVAHMDVLVEEGRARAVEDGGVTAYVRA